MPTQKKRFSIKTRMVIIFGLLLAASLIVLSFLEMYRSYKALMETVEAHLIDKTSDAAALIDSEMRQWFKLLDGIAMQPILCDATVSYRAKAVFLKKLAAVEASIIKLSLVDTNGKYYLADGQVLDASGTQWFKDSQRGTQCVFSAPFKSVETGELVTVIAVPIKEESGSTVDILVAVIDGFELCNFSDEIVVGKTGNCFITDKQGVVIADSDRTLVEQGFNVDVEFRKNQSLASLFGFLDKLYRSNEKTVTDYYTSPSSGSKMIACGATTKINEWKLTAVAPVSDFLSALNALRSSVTIIVTLMILVAIIIVYVVARSIVNPISRTAGVLRDIAQGEGDLTVRLPVLGNDEITDMSEYFNETIEKIGTSIRQVGVNSNIMEEIGNELASNMSETASAVHQISANIDSVKQQAITQAASVTETAATIEEIVRTIKQLNTSIETQAGSVAQSSASVEQMVANIASIGQTLDKTNEVIKSLTTATGDGKATLATSNTVTQKIAEESGSLIEASSVIQHIASQTNLLAMNAAIEAAHAGEAGKGFAVVADEIRKLAEESAMQGQTITATLKTLSGEIETLSTSSKTVEEKFNIIFSLAEQVKEMSVRLTEAMESQENGSQEVLTAIKRINTVTTEVQAGSEEMLKGGEGVAEEMQKLDSLTRVITESMNDMASGAVQISNAVQEVNAITQRNKTSIESLAEEVGKFKV